MVILRALLLPVSMDMSLVCCTVGTHSGSRLRLARTLPPDRGSRVDARDDETKALRVARDEEAFLAPAPLFVIPAQAGIQ